MPGMFGAFGPSLTPLAQTSIDRTIDPAGLCRLETYSNAGGWVRLARFPFDDLEHRDLVEGSWRGWFIGDIPEHNAVPWSLLLDAVKSWDFSRLRELHMPFAAAIHDQRSGQAYLISDRRAQQPLYFGATNGNLLFSTAVPSFCGLLDKPVFCREWLFETLYFNHPILDTTFLQGVRRLPPATILSWDPVTGASAMQNYASAFSRPDSLATGRQGMELAQQVFAQAASGCFATRLPLAASLTAGFDSRAVLAYAPKPDSVDLITYTYGIPGCYDLTEAAGVAAGCGLSHLSIHFDSNFISLLPGLLVGTVYQSGGSERILRSTLLHVFGTLYDAGRRVIVSGVSGDHIFRDHLRGTGNVPSLISAPMMNFIQNQQPNLGEPEFANILGSHLNSFVEHIRGCLEGLAQRHGDLHRPEGYQRYLVYENAPKYFGGEAAVAGTRHIFRTPYWDDRVVDLAFTTSHGTLGLSERLPGKDRYLEAALQGYLIQRSPHYGRFPVKGVSAEAYSRGNRALYRLERILRQGTKRLARAWAHRPAVFLEDWPGWMRGPLAPLVAELLGSESRLSAQFGPQAAAFALSGRDLQKTSQLVTAEIVLRLLENHWQLDGAALPTGVADLAHSPNTNAQGSPL